MSRPWHKADPALLAKMIAEVQLVYPHLHFYSHADRVVVRGTFPILDSGNELDRYSVDIVLPADYPKSIPIVREVGGRIPHSADFHIIAKTGEACLFVPDERWRVYPPGASFLDFLNGPVRNFFLGQTVFRATGEWPFGQRPHGPDGIREFYADLLGTKDAAVLLSYVEYLSRPTLKGHWPCPCQSGKRLRDCHRDQINDLTAKIPREVARKSWDALRTADGPRRAQDI